MTRDALARSTHVSEDVGLTAEPGTILCLAGPPGSGKSALLRNMLPETKVDDAALLVDKRGRIRPRRRPAVFRRGVSGLRAGIRRAPRLLLLDEPIPLFTAGDGREHLQRMLADYPGAVMITTSNFDDASIADRIAVVDAGTIAQTGTRDELFDRPRTRFVAAAAGTNFFTALARSGKLLIGHSTISTSTSLDGRVLVTLPPDAVALHATDPLTAGTEGPPPATDREADTYYSTPQQAAPSKAAPGKASPSKADVFAARVVRLSPGRVGLSPIDPERGLELVAADTSSGWRLGQHVFASVDVDRIKAYPF